MGNKPSLPRRKSKPHAKPSKVRKHSVPKNSHNQQEYLTRLKESIFGNSEQRFLQVPTKPRPELSRNETVDQRILQGRSVSSKYVKPTRQKFRVYLSSSFTDTKVELDTFIAFVLPQLRTLAHDHNLEFEVGEIPWGVTESVVSYHQTEKVYTGELGRFTDDSIDCMFVGILGNKYGFRPLPRQVVTLPSPHDSILKTWYKFDRNSETFVLQPIQSVLPSYNPDVEDEHSKAWKEAFTKMQNFFDQAGMEKTGHGLLSVPQREMTAGILSPEAKGKTLLVVREFPESDVPLGDYRDDHEVPLKALKQRLKDAMEGDDVFERNVPWVEDGIDPVNCVEHRQYLTDLMRWLCDRLANSILSQPCVGVDSVVEEANAHWWFALSQESRAQWPRADVLEELEEHIRNNSITVVHGPSGSGKSTILAQFALNPPHFANNKEMYVVSRFVSATVNSRSTFGLLSGLCEQLKRLYPETLEAVNVPDDLSRLVMMFNDTFLSAASEEHPLLLVVDGLDRIRETDAQRVFDWIPLVPPPNVWIVISTVEVSHFDLKTGFQVPCITTRLSCSSLLQAMLGKPNARSLSKEQQQCILDTFEKSKTRTILQFELLFNEAISSWYSYTPLPPHEWEEVTDIRSTIKVLLGKWRQKHGNVLFDKAVSLITWSRHGLSQTELSDLLSLDDEVLQSLFTHRVPPLARVPPLVTARLLADLAPYLTASNTWFSRQFQKVCESQHKGLKRVKAFEAFSKYFSGGTQGQSTWITLVSGEKWLLSADRGVTPPLPMRAVRELPRALIELGDWERLSDIFCKFEFLLQAAQHNLQDFEYQCERASLLRLAALNKGSEKKLHRLHIPNLARALSAPVCRDIGISDLEVVHRLISLSRSALLRDHRQLAGQVIGRISNSKVQLRPRLLQLIQDANNYKPGVHWWKPLHPYLESATATAVKRTIHTGTSQFRDLAVSANGKTIATATGKSVLFWDAGTGSPKPGMKVLKHKSEVETVAFSQDGRYIATGCYDKTVNLWEARSGLLVGGAFVGHDGKVNGVCFTPDSKSLISCSADTTIRIWDIKSRKTRKVLTGGHQDWVTAVSSSDDGKLVASGGYDAKVCLWDAGTWKLRFSLQGHGGTVWAVAFPPDGASVASASRDRTVRVWDTKSGALRLALEGHSDWVLSLAFSPSGRYLASGSRDRHVLVWSLETGTRERVLAGHGGAARALAWGEEDTVVSGSEDRSVRVWDPHYVEETAEVLDTVAHAGHVNAVAFSFDGSTVASGAQDGSVRLWDIHTGDPKLQGKALEGHSSPIAALAFCPDGHTLASGSFDGKIHLWDARTGEVSWCGSAIDSGQNGVFSLAFSPDCSTLVSGGGDQSLRFWNQRTGLAIFPAHSTPTRAGQVNDVTFSTDGSTVRSGYFGQEAQYWKSETGKPLRAQDDRAVNFEGQLDKGQPLERDGTAVLVPKQVGAEGSIGFCVDNSVQLAFWKVRDGKVYGVYAAGGTLGVLVLE